jgi:hypothetical protein
MILVVVAGIELQRDRAGQIGVERKPHSVPGLGTNRGRPCTDCLYLQDKYWTKGGPPSD